MADAKVRNITGPVALRVESGMLLSPVTVANKISNFVETEEGTLRSVWGPTPYAFAENMAGDFVPNSPTGTAHGIGHGILQKGSRDVLLVHCGDTIYEYIGWSNSWRELIGPGAGAQYQADLVNDEKPRAPTQFFATPNGIIIVPQDSRAFMYDGYCVLPLGYDRTPGPPQGLGPSSSATVANNAGGTGPGINDLGYALDAQRGASTSIDVIYGECRVGTVERFPGGTVANATTSANDAAVGVTGQLLDGSYRGATQWIDYFGNLSPVSGRSSPISFSLQHARTFDSGGPTWLTAKMELVLKQVGWSGIDKGPEGTIGRILCRTKDEKHSGTTELFEIPSNASEAVSNYATIPDNLSSLYADNTPDSWLIRAPVYPVPVRKFKYGCIAFGRFWAANWENDIGKVHCSQPGKFGTFAEGDAYYPDPSTSGVTGIFRAANGLLVCTQSSTFLFSAPIDGSNNFVQHSISATAGCLAASSMSALPDGRVVWLGREGFYGFDGQSVSLISESLNHALKSLNRNRAIQACAATDASGEYRCWVPMNGSRKNNVCFCFDGEGWKERTDVEAAGVCVTQDYRSYMVAVGECTGRAPGELLFTEKTSAWILDNEVHTYIPDPRSNVVETSWIANDRPAARTSGLSVDIWMRETRQGEMTIEVFRDWRMSPAIQTVTDFALYATDDISPFWGTAVFDATLTPARTPNTYRRKRPYWRRVHISVPSCEVYKIRISSEYNVEYIGFVFEDQPKDNGGSRTPP